LKIQRAFVCYVKFNVNSTFVKIFAQDDIDRDSKREANAVDIAAFSARVVGCLARHDCPQPKDKREKLA
jgi:hypothetical protein